MYNYAITINKVSDPVFISDYEGFIMHLKKKYPNSEFEYHYEEKRSGVSDRLHMHGTITNHRKIKMTTLFKDYKHGWSVLWKEDPDIGWNHYIQKYQEDETELINRSHSLEREYNEFQKIQRGVEGTSTRECNDLPDACKKQYSDEFSEEWLYPNLDIRTCKISG